MLYYSSGTLFTLMERQLFSQISVSPSNPLRLVRYDQIYSYICDNYPMTSARKNCRAFSYQSILSLQTCFTKTVLLLPPSFKKSGFSKPEVFWSKATFLFRILQSWWAITILTYFIKLFKTQLFDYSLSVSKKIPICKKSFAVYRIIVPYLHFYENGLFFIKIVFFTLKF